MTSISRSSRSFQAEPSCSWGCRTGPNWLHDYGRRDTADGRREDGPAYAGVRASSVRASSVHTDATGPACAGFQASSVPASFQSWLAAGFAEAHKILEHGKTRRSPQRSLASSPASTACTLVPRHVHSCGSTRFKTKQHFKNNILTVPLRSVRNPATVPMRKRPW
jgi:hypothetical protein